MKNLILEHQANSPASNGRVAERVSAARETPLVVLKLAIALATSSLCVFASSATARQANANPHLQARTPRSSLPPRVIEAQRFLAKRGWTPGQRLPARSSAPRKSNIRADANGAYTDAAASATWQPLGPMAVQTPAFGLVTGRVAALAFDPSDASGNRLYLGTTGGGVWVAQNAGTSNPSSVTFTPLTDTLAALGGAADASINIGALTVQPGGAGVILAGTGDPNDMLDSYY